MDDIAVIVVNWNAREDLRACLRSLLPPESGSEDGPQVTYSVWVVDNASRDGSAEMVRAEFPEAHLIANTENTGFSKGNNQAIAQSREPGSRYMFLLNSDAQVHPGALDALVAWADTHPQAGIVGPKVLNPDGSLQFSCRRFPTLGAGFFRNTYLGRWFPNNRYAKDYLMTEFDHAQVRSVDWVSGCAMLLRRAMIDQIGALDERFYMYCEDVDLCQRAWDAGWEVVYMPDALVTHAIGRSSDKDAERMIWEFHRSWYEFDKKRHPRGGPLRRTAVRLGLSLRAEVRVLKRRIAQRKSPPQAGVPSGEPHAGHARPEGERTS